MAQRFIDLVSFEVSATEAFKKSFTDDIWTIDYWPGGKRLFAKILLKANGVFDSKWDVRFTANGCGVRNNGILYYDPAYFSGPYFEPTQRAVLANRKSYVYLYHEIVHWLHYLEGTFQTTPQEELRTVGLYDTANEEFSENKFRKEVGLPRRPCYYWIRTPQNSSGYEYEKQKRLSRKLPDASLLGPQSPECSFNFAP